MEFAPSAELQALEAEVQLSLMQLRGTERKLQQQLVLRQQQQHTPYYAQDNQHWQQQYLSKSMSSQTTSPLHPQQLFTTPVTRVPPLELMGLRSAGQPDEARVGYHHTKSHSLAAAAASNAALGPSRSSAAKKPVNGSPSDRRANYSRQHHHQHPASLQAVLLGYEGSASTLGLAHQREQLRQRMRPMEGLEELPPRSISVDPAEMMRLRTSQAQTGGSGGVPSTQPRFKLSHQQLVQSWMAGEGSHLRDDPPTNQYERKSSGEARDLFYETSHLATQGSESEREHAYFLHK